MIAASASGDVLAEVGAILLILAVVGRVATRLGLPPIPLYLTAGLLLGEGSALPLDSSTEFIATCADIGVVLLLLLLGLEYTPDELRTGLTTGWAAGVTDLVASSAPGILAGLLLGWGFTAALVLGGVTYISSSGIVAKQIFDLDRMANRETPTVLSILVFEDLVMAVFLPILGVLLIGGAAGEAMWSITVAVGVVAAALVVTYRHGHHLNRALDTNSAELLVLSIVGLALLAGGLAEQVRVSAAVAAFLVGVALAGRVADRGRELLTPLRDLFGGLFFVYFGLQVDPSTLPPVLLPALLLAVVGAGTKTATGWWAAGRAGIGPRGRLRAGLSLIPRGEFSVVIAGLAVTAGVDRDFGPLTAAYVLILAVVGSMATRYADQLPLPARRPVAATTT